MHHKRTASNSLIIQPDPSRGETVRDCLRALARAGFHVLTAHRRPLGDDPSNALSDDVIDAHIRETRADGGRVLLSLDMTKLDAFDRSWPMGLSVQQLRDGGWLRIDEESFEGSGIAANHSADELIASANNFVLTPA